RLGPEDYPVPGLGFEPAALRLLGDIHPERCEYLGGPAVRALVRRGVEVARRHGADVGPGPAVLTALVVALGHGCDDDPLHPWISGALGDPRLSDPARRAGRLQTRARTCLAETLAFLERR